MIICPFSAGFVPVWKLRLESSVIESDFYLLLITCYERFRPYTSLKKDPIRWSLCLHRHFFSVCKIGPSIRKVSGTQKTELGLELE